ncbi:unnamed protein product [marine sediment metagenome]|uniref:Uncharacterized protein n=1 Tax=marine sediment metagenome TaxID=412755 RepID=X1TY46_9ZZZZ
MAKTKGPLFSISASGALAKTLVYGDWKGIDYVRQYVIPANPKTADQQEQRGFFSAAIDAWHIDGYTEDDVTAWNLYALAQKIAASGFNMFVKLKVLAAVAVKTWGALTDCVIASITSSGCEVTIDVPSDLTGILYIGTSKTSMLTQFTGTYLDPGYTFTVIDLVADTRYYFYIANTITDEVARTGIYSFKTAAA